MNMTNINYEKLENIDQAHGLKKEELNTSSEFIEEYITKIKRRQQGFYQILDDVETIQKIKDYAKNVEGKYEHIIVLGIGGSSLGAICLKESLTHLYKSTSPTLYVLDNIDPVMISEIEDVIDYSKTLFLVITKSGNTPEILAQYSYFRTKSDEKNLSAQDHFVIITDPISGTMRKIAEEENLKSFSIPPDVGGRFSVLTPVGLLPAALIGINIDELINGAKKMRDNFLSTDYDTNLPYQLAQIQFLLNKKGKNINVLMPYAQKLYRLADWYRQLLAESTGKKFNDEKNKVYTGITPVNALGATDQHSQSQLYNEGPNDKLIMFIEIKNLGDEIKIPGLKEGMQFLNGITFSKLISVEKTATQDSLTKNNRPTITIEIDEITPTSIGELFMLFEGSIAFLGEFLKINAFDQPGVELSKVLTKEYLETISP